MTTHVLVTATVQRRKRLLEVLEGIGLEISVASSLEEARQKLCGSISYDLLLVDAELPDGSWMDLLQFVLDSGKSCEAIVCARCGDEHLWAEVIQCGAYDLIPEPYERQEVLRIIESAIGSQYMRRLNTMRMCKPA